MGYGIILASDDQQLREELRRSPEQAVAELQEVLGTSNYPGTHVVQSRAGAWTRIASVHSGTTVAICLSAHDSRVLEFHEDCPDDGTWHSARAWRTDIQAALSAAGAVPASNAARGESAASLWWMYADSLPWTLTSEAAERLGRELEAALTRESEGIIAVGAHTNALNRAGGVSGSGTCELWWSSGRIARLDEMSEEERAIVRRR